MGIAYFFMFFNSSVHTFWDIETSMKHKVGSVQKLYFSTSAHSHEWYGLCWRGPSNCGIRVAFCARALRICQQVNQWHIIDCRIFMWWIIWTWSAKGEDQVSKGKGVLMLEMGSGSGESMGGYANEQGWYANSDCWLVQDHVHQLSSKWDNVCLEINIWWDWLL